MPLILSLQQGSTCGCWALLIILQIYQFGSSDSYINEPFTLRVSWSLDTNEPCVEFKIEEILIILWWNYSSYLLLALWRPQCVSVTYIFLMYKSTPELLVHMEWSLSTHLATSSTLHCVLFLNLYDKHLHHVLSWAGFHSEVHLCKICHLVLYVNFVTLSFYQQGMQICAA